MHSKASVYQLRPYPETKLERRTPKLSTTALISARVRVTVLFTQLIRQLNILHVKQPFIGENKSECFF